MNEEKQECLFSFWDNMQAEYAAVMEKQEAARQKQLADAKARQARQVADAATRPEFKKWIDDDMIERNAR
jgi:hypothetical protein